MLKEKINHILDNVEVFNPRWYMGQIPIRMYMRKIGELPVRDIQTALERYYGWKVSAGAIKAAMK